MMTLKNLDEDQRNILAEIIGIDVNQINFDNY
jgi:hypothetical protein